MTDGLAPEPGAAAPTAGAARARIVHLDQEADQDKIGSFDPIQSATAAGLRADIKFRGWMVFAMCVLFVSLNAAVMLFVWHAFQQDLVLMTRPAPMPASNRLVTTQVVMSLIGATVVQTGVGFITIVSYLFPRRDVGAG